MEDNRLVYWREAKEHLGSFVDSVLIGFAEDLATAEGIMPCEFTERMRGAMSMARRLKDALEEKEAGTDDDG